MSVTSIERACLVCGRMAPVVNYGRENGREVGYLGRLPSRPPPSRRGRGEGGWGSQQEALQDAYRADIAARGVVAVVAPHVPEQRRAS